MSGAARKMFSRKCRGYAATFRLAVLLFVLVPLASSGQGRWKYSLEPPLTVDFDMEDIPEPKERVRSTYYDFLYATFGSQIKQGFDLPRNVRKLSGKPKEAYNVDPFGEVPDSSWFTNRNAKRPLTLAEIQRGPNRGTGPAAGLWTVIQAKTEGISPGFLIRDSMGDIYQLKFDPPDYPEMATAAEVIASKLYYAAGYNVKENYIVLFARDRLTLDAKATTKDRYGRTRPMTHDDLEAILSRVARRSDGRYRAVAGKFLDGIAKGPFSFEGVREDDPNDWIPHEHRRDLRGLRVFCSWVNENDFREGNTLDMYVEEDGRRFLRHYLIDLGSSLGSDTTHPNIDRIGNEYILDAGEIAKSVFSLGLYRRPWKGSSQRGSHPNVGFLEAEIFEPARWKPNYPVLPFENMTRQDAFWGTKLVLSFTDEQIRAAVKSGEFSDPGATELLTRVLIERRDKIGRYWLSQVNPLDGFAIETDAQGYPQLRFVDLFVQHGFASAGERSYEFTICAEGAPNQVLARGVVQEPRIALRLPAEPSQPSRPEEVFQVSIRTVESNGKRPGGAIRVYLLRRAGKDFALAGVERTD